MAQEKRHLTLPAKNYWLTAFCVCRFRIMRTRKDFPFSYFKIQGKKAGITQGVLVTWGSIAGELRFHIDQLLSWNIFGMRISYQFEQSFFWKLDFKISQLQNVIQKRILGRSNSNFRQNMQNSTENEKNVFSNLCPGGVMYNVSQYMEINFQKHIHPCSMIDGKIL